MTLQDAAQLRRRILQRRLAVILQLQVRHQLGVLARLGDGQDSALALALVVLVVFVPLVDIVGIRIFVLIIVGVIRGLGGELPAKDEV